MRQNIKVRCGGNGPVYMEGHKRMLGRDGKDIYMIYEEAVEVPDTRYYRRRIIKGDLLEVTNMAAPARAFDRATMFEVMGAPMAGENATITKKKTKQEDKE